MKQYPKEMRNPLLLFLCTLCLALSGCQGKHDYSITEQPRLDQVEGLLAPNIPNQIASGVFFIGPGDTVAVDIWNQPDLSKTYTVDENGFLFCHLFDQSIEMREMTQSKLRLALTNKYNDYLVNPSVAITVTLSLNRKVTVLGSVANPGVYPLSTPSTSVLEVIAQAGGIDTEGDTTGVVLARFVNQKIQVRAYGLDSLFDPESPDVEAIIPVVQPGDYVYVLRTPKAKYASWLRLISETLRAIQWGERALLLAPDVSDSLFSNEN